MLSWQRVTVVFNADDELAPQAMSLLIQPRTAWVALVTEPLSSAQRLHGLQALNQGLF
jgi:hypothetical protein